ncbi:MAG TPA: ECF-type sigma factor [Terriglobales bacterium]|jgi:DNA-directed RNA polymerase specialized sigma24 family protein|nr:ECF-type sigma factor [Terriglobales bacterium]
MAWDAINLRSQGGMPVSPAERQIIFDVAEKAILNSDRDPDIVLRAAARVSRKLDLIGNLRAYATRAISRALNKAEKAQKRKDALVSFGDMEAAVDFSQNDKIENEILVRELLDTFTPQDREIFLRRMNGDKFPEIDSEMNLKPRTAEQRFRVCKASLRQILQDKLNRRASLRGR